MNARNALSRQLSWLGKLDEAEELDDGNPEELGQQLAQIKRRFPHIRVLGGCCGTDMRHMQCIAKASVQ